MAAGFVRLVGRQRKVTLREAAGIFDIYWKGNGRKTGFKRQS